MYRFLENLLENKKVLILGFGREGRSTYNVIKNIDCKIGIADANDVRFDCDASFHIGEDYQKSVYDYDIVFKSPGVVLEDKSEAVLEKIIAQTDCMLKVYNKNIIGITGTKGKSTVTTLVYHILKNAIGNAVLMGNIGIPAFDMLGEINGDSLIVYELSCHQLEYSPYSPHTAVLLNIFEEHLDHYGTLDKYVEAKQNIYKNQKSDDVLICNVNNIPENIVGRVITASLDEGENADISIGESNIKSFGETFDFDELETTLCGRHNMYNIAIAYNVCKLFGVSIDDFKKHLKTYKPLPHRLEFAGEFDGIKYYDDSISTISETTINGLSSLKNVGTLIIGGMDRGISYQPLMDFLKTYPLDNIIFMYDTGRIIYEIIEKECKDDFADKKLILTDTLENAVLYAKKYTPKGKICLMSPAAASYGFFNNFEHRGEMFKQYIAKGRCQ